MSNAAGFNLLERQREALTRMLHLNATEEEERKARDAFTVRIESPPCLPLARSLALASLPLNSRSCCWTDRLTDCSLRAPQGVWKALIFDEACGSILAPLLFPSDLRRLGVTLFLYAAVPPLSALPLALPLTDSVVSVVCISCVCTGRCTRLAIAFRYARASASLSL
jgi:hypothetical protein